MILSRAEDSNGGDDSDISSNGRRVLRSPGDIPIDSVFGLARGSQVSERCCFLLPDDRFGVSLWVVVLSLLFDPMVGTGADFVLWLIYSALVGATPLAAFPGLFLYGSGKRQPVCGVARWVLQKALPISEKK